MAIRCTSRSTALAKQQALKHCVSMPYVSGLNLVLVFGICSVMGAGLVATTPYSEIAVQTKAAGSREGIGVSKSKRGPDVFVVKSKAEPGKFFVKEGGNPTPLSRPSSQARSIEKAIPKAKTNQSDVVIQGRDGKFRDRDSYGNDPNPPKDKKH